MKYILYTVLGTAVIFFAGVYTGVRFNKSSEAEYPYVQIAAIEPSEIAPAEQALTEPKTQTIQANYTALPDDMFIRLKNEADKKTVRKDEEVKPETKQEEQQNFIRDDKTIAHSEAAEGIGYIEKGSYDTAAVHLAKAFALYPDKSIAAHYLKALIMLGEQEKAAEVLSAAELNEDTLADIIEIAVQNNRYREALKLLKNYPATNGRLIHAAGLAYEAAGDTEKAVEMYKHAYAKEPENTVIIFSMARAADIEGDYTAALRLYEQTARLSATAALTRYAALRSMQIREYLASLGSQSSVSPE